MAESAWDTTLAVGELVTAYYSGYHIIVRFAYRSPPELAPLMYTVRVADAAGNLVKNKREYCCDAGFAKRHSKTRIELEWSDELEQAHKKRDNLLQFVTV